MPRYKRTSVPDGSSCPMASCLNSHETALYTETSAGCTKNPSLPKSLLVPRHSANTHHHRIPATARYLCNTVCNGVSFRTLLRLFPIPHPESSSRTPDLHRYVLHSAHVPRLPLIPAYTSLHLHCSPYGKQCPAATTFRCRFYPLWYASSRSYRRNLSVRSPFYFGIISPNV